MPKAAQLQGLSLCSTEIFRPQTTSAESYLKKQTDTQNGNHVHTVELTNLSPLQALLLTRFVSSIFACFRSFYNAHEGIHKQN